MENDPALSDPGHQFMQLLLQRWTGIIHYSPRLGQDLRSFSAHAGQARCPAHRFVDSDLCVSLTSLPEVGVYELDFCCAAGCTSGRVLGYLGLFGHPLLAELSLQERECGLPACTRGVQYWVWDEEAGCELPVDKEYLPPDYQG